MDSARERSPRRDHRDSSAPRRSGGGGGPGRNTGGGQRRAPPERRVFVSNIPFEMKWQEIKDLFRDNVGDVSYVELFNDENEKPRGCGILEFATDDLAKNAIEKMHRHEYKGRKLVVKEDFDTERDKYGRISKGGSAGAGGGGRSDRERSDRGPDRRDRRDHSSNMGPPSGGYGNTYGLSPQFLESLGIDGPLHTRLFVANLSYTVDERKLREVFRLAGRVVMVELNRDKDGKSRGHAVLEFDHPVEAVQAISMFNDQAMFDRKMTVRFDKTPGPSPEELAQLPSRLPEGLGGVGMGLGSGGNPLTEVAKNLPGSNNTQNNQNMAGASTTSQAGQGDNLAQTVNILKALMATNNTAGPLSNLAGGMGLGNMGGNNMATPNNMMGGGASMGGNNMAAPSNMMGGSGMGGIGMGGFKQESGAGPMGGSMNTGGMGSQMSMGGGSMGSTMDRGFKMEPNTGGYSSSGGGGRGSVSSGGYGGNMGRGMNDSQQGHGSYDTIIIRNLPMDCNWQVLRDGFSNCGEIKFVEMKERGTGIIRFASPRDADRAVSMMDKQTVSGRVISVHPF